MTGNRQADSGRWMDDRHRWLAVRSGTALSVPSSNVPSSWAGRDKVRTEQCTTAGFLGALGPKGQVPAPPAQRAEPFLSSPPNRVLADFAPPPPGQGRGWASPAWWPSCAVPWAAPGPSAAWTPSPRAQGGLPQRLSSPGIFLGAGQCEGRSH